MARPRRMPNLDLADPGEQLPLAQEVYRHLTMRGLREPERSQLRRVHPDATATAVQPGGTPVVVLETPWVREELRRHLAPGTVVTAYPDPEPAYTTVRLPKPLRAVPVRLWAVRVPTPDGDVRLWTDEIALTDEETPTPCRP